MLGAAWREATDDDKSVYQGKAEKEKARYEAEMKKYKPAAEADAED